jgi:hypothetical protein
MRKLSLLFAMLTAAAGCASAQLVSVGALGGVRLTDGYSYDDESRSYVVGGSLEVHLPAGFALEADALYQRLGETSSLTAFLPSPYFLVARTRGNDWEFPLYVKYYFRPHTAAWQPFIGSGFAFRTVSFHQDSSDFGIPNLGNGNYHSDFRSDLGVGASVLAGLRFHYGPVAFLPQVRYTRWGETNGINNNEVTLLLGVSF